MDKQSKPTISEFNGEGLYFFILDNYLDKCCAKKRIEKMTQQLHVDVNSEQLRNFKAAVKALGYGTMSEYIRTKIRQAIREAEEIDRRVS